MDLSFIVPVRDDARRLGRCLETIAASRSPGIAAEVLVADNGSTDDSRDVARAAGARVLDMPNLRVAAMRNQAVASATGRFLAFVDADHEVANGWSAAALEVMQDARIGATGALYLAPPDGTWVQRMYGVLRGRSIGRREVPWLGSGNLVVRRETFDLVGGFDVSLEACEDVDFCQRLRTAGWPIIADERLASVHQGDPPTLGVLFRAERWRGRDNIRVSLRGPLGWRDVPSLVVPVVELLGALGLVAAALLWWPAAGWAIRIGLPSAVPFILFPLLRAARMVRSGGLKTSLDWGRAWLVALTYDAARAAALVGRARHHRASPPPTRATESK
jgi:GT2 family glycosyltransferase